MDNLYHSLMCLIYISVTILTAMACECASGSTYILMHLGVTGIYSDMLDL